MTAPTPRMLSAYREMRRIRAFEDVVGRAHRDGLLPGLLHLSTGGEAVAVGVIGQLTDDDRVYTAHRGHGHFLAAGVEPYELMAELAGRESGLCAGRGGSMHLMSRRAVLATGVVGGSLPIAVGHAIALAPEAVAVAFFGDGAVQTGVFHEAINLAALWQAPVMFVCENNGWAEFSSREEHTTVPEVRMYGDLHRLRTGTVDGSEYQAVHSVAADLIGSVRAGGGPALLECHISRMRPHYEGDLRRLREDVRDPLNLLAETLLASGIAEAEIARLDADAVAAAEAVLERALADPPADPAGDLDLVFERAVP